MNQNIMTHFVKKLLGFFFLKQFETYDKRWTILVSKELKLHKNKTIRDQYFDEQSRFK